MDGAFPSEKGQSFDGGYGAGGRGRGRGGFRGTAENAKTKLCTRWMQGDCRFGDRCNFAHGEHELRKLPDGGPGRGRGGYGGGRGYTNSFGGRGPQGYGGGGYGNQPGYGGYGVEQGGYGGGQPGGGEQLGEDVWAAQGYPVQGPNGWTMYRTKESGEPYYHNHRTGQTVWDRPPEWPQGGM